jgi:hypothetical protein
MLNLITADPAITYFTLLKLRGGFLFGGMLFSAVLRSNSSLVIHAVTILLAAAEYGAAWRSTTAPDLRQKRWWTATNIALYAAALLALVACFRAPRELWSPRGFSSPSFEPMRRMLYLPDLLAAVTWVAAFFTLPALRIRHWHSLPQDEGFIVGGAIPVVSYSDRVYEDDNDEGGESRPLAATFHAQQEGRGGGRDDESIVALV